MRPGRWIPLAGLCLMTPVAAPGQVVTLVPTTPTATTYWPGAFDSALTVVVGHRGKARLRVSPGGVAAYSVTVFLDDARVRVVLADSVPGQGLPTLTLTPGAGQVTVAGSGTGTAFNTELAELTVEMDSTAIEGSLLSLKVNSLTSSAPGAADLLPSHRVGVLNVCQARSYWGDLSGDRAVSSRDALIALTAAVGMSTTGFDLSFGDVDRDSSLTSRDALIILSHSVRLLTFTWVGLPKANRCAPLHPAPQDLLFFRANDLYRVAAADTIPLKIVLPVAPYTANRAMWSPDGTKVLYTGFTSPFGYEVLSSTGPLFSTTDTLTRNGSFDAGADWAPDGTRIAFVSNRVFPAGVFVMNANGTGQTQVATPNVTVNTGEPVSWSPDGTRIAFVGYTGLCCPYGIWTVTVDGATLTEILPGSLGQNPQDPVWTNAGDSILYTGGGEVRVVAATPAATGARLSRLNAAQDFPAPSNAGPAFRSLIRFPYDFYLLRASDGRHLRMVRGTTGFTDATGFSVRRSGVVFVQSVTASPSPLTIDRAVSATATLTATVTNSNTTTNNTAALSWTSGNTAVATVSPTGARTADVTGVGPGTATITVSAGGWRSVAVSVTVN